MFTKMFTWKEKKIESTSDCPDHDRDYNAPLYQKTLNIVSWLLWWRVYISGSD